MEAMVAKLLYVHGLAAVDGRRLDHQDVRAERGLLEVLGNGDDLRDGRPNRCCFHRRAVLAGSAGTADEFHVGGFAHGAAGLSVHKSALKMDNL